MSELWAVMSPRDDECECRERGVEKTEVKYVSPNNGAGFHLGKVVTIKAYCVVTINILIAQKLKLKTLNPENPK